MPGGKHFANIWTGKFPELNTEEDGFRGTCPVTKFPESKFGHKNMIGNVWEWTQVKRWKWNFIRNIFWVLGCF